MNAPSISESKQIVFVPPIELDPPKSPPFEIDSKDAPLLKREFLPVDTPEDRLFNKLLNAKVLNADEEMNTDFIFPAIPELSSQEGDLNPLFTFLQQKIKIHDQQKGWTTQRELWELLDCLKNLRGIEKLHLVGGRAMAVLPLAWHLKAARSLNIFDEEDLKELAQALSSLPHKPKDSDIRFYSPSCNAFGFDLFKHAALKFLTNALCEVEKKKTAYKDILNLKSTCLDNFFHCPDEGNDYSIIAFGKPCQASIEMMLVHRLHRNFLFLNHAFEIPLEDPIRILKEKKRNSSSASQVVKNKQNRRGGQTSGLLKAHLQPSCYKMNSETGELQQEKIHTQWEALLSFWLKRLHTKKSGKINKIGWARSLVNEIEGQTRRNAALSEHLFEKMTNAIVSLDKIPEIVYLLNKAVKEHFGEDKYLFISVAFQVCQRLKDKFQESELRRIWKGMLSYARSIEEKEVKQKIPSNPFFAALEKLMNDESIPFQFVSDLIQLKGLFSIARKEEKTDLSFHFKKHLNLPTIQVRILGPKTCCLHIPFYFSACIENILSNKNLLNKPLAADFFAKLFKNEGGSIFEIDRLQNISRLLNLPIESWETYALDLIGQDLPVLKEFGWTLLMIVSQLKPSEKGIKTLVCHILELISKGKNDHEIQRIFQTLDRSQELYPESSHYLREAVESLRRFLGRIEQEKYDPAVSSKNQKERQAHYVITWIKQLAQSSNDALRGLAEAMAKAFLALDPSHIVLGYGLIEISAKKRRFHVAFKMMEHLQEAKEGRSVQKELDSLYALIDVLQKPNSSQLKSLGKIALRIIRGWNLKNDERPRNILPLLEFLKTLWNEPEYANTGLQCFQELIRKEMVNADNLDGKYWLDACFKAINNPDCGISAAIDMWKKGLKIWKSKIDKGMHAEFCIRLLQSLHEHHPDYAGMYAGKIFKELFSILKVLKEQNDDLFLHISKRVENLAAQFNYTERTTPKNSFGHEFLFRLRIREISVCIDAKKWRSVLDILLQLFNSDLKKIDVSCHASLIELIERFIREAAFTSQDLPKLIEIVQMRPFVDMMSAFPNKYISILSSTLTKAENASVNPVFLDQLLELFLCKAEAPENFAACLPSILKIWTGHIEKDAEYAKIVPPDLILKMLIKTESDQDLVSLILLLKQKSLLNKCSPSLLDCVWGRLTKLSFTASTQDLRKCYNAFVVLLRTIPVKKGSKESLQIVKNLLLSDQPFQFSEIFKYLPSLDPASVKELCEICRAKEVETQFHFLKMISGIPECKECIGDKWQELLSKSHKEHSPDLHEIIELNALRYSVDTSRCLDVEKKILALLIKNDSHDDLDLILDCLAKYKILSVEIWKSLVNALYVQGKRRRAEFLPICKIFLRILKDSEESKVEINFNWTVFFDAAQQLPLSQWLPLMRELPDLSQVFNPSNQENEDALYKKVLSKGLEGLPETFEEELFLDLMDLRKKLSALRSSLITPEDIRFFEWVIRCGNKKCIQMLIDEVPNAHAPFILTKLCSRLISDSYQNQQSQIWVEKQIVNLFINSFMELGSKLKDVFHKVINNISLLRFFKIIFFIFESDEEAFYQITSGDEKAIIKKLVRINTGKSLEIALKLEKSSVGLKNKVFLRLFQYISQGTDILKKRGFLELYCKNYPSISKDGKLKEEFEQTVVNSIASIPQTKENWALFNLTMSGVINCMHPISARNKWTNLVENDLDKDLPIVVFGDNLSLEKEESLIQKERKQFEERKKIQGSRKKNVSVRKKRTQLSAEETENKNFHLFFLKFANALIDYFSTEEVFEHTDPKIILSIIKLITLQFNNIIVRTRGKEEENKIIYESIEKTLNRLTYDFSFIDESLNAEHCLILTDLYHTHFHLFKEIDSFHCIERSVYFSFEYFAKNHTELESNVLIDNKILINLVSNLLKKRKKSSYLKSLNLLRIGYKFLPSSISELKYLFEYVFTFLEANLDEIVDNVSVVEEIRIIISSHGFQLCSGDLLKISQDEEKNQSEKLQILNGRYKYSISLFYTFFHFVFTLYQKPQNVGKKIRIEEFRPNKIKELPLKEYLLLALKEAFEQKIFLIGPARYKELLTKVLSL